MMGVRRQDQIVTLPAPREIYLGVIKNMVCAKRSAVSTFLVLHTAVTSAPKALAICTANVPTPPDAPSIKNLAAWPDPSLVAKTLQRGACRDGYCCRILKR